MGRTCLISSGASSQVAVLMSPSRMFCPIIPARFTCIGFGVERARKRDRKRERRRQRKAEREREIESERERGKERGEIGVRILEFQGFQGLTGSLAEP